MAALVIVMDAIRGFMVLAAAFLVVLIFVFTLGLLFGWWKFL